MEAEVINQLNNTLNDLEKRSEDIRVYMDYQGKKDRLEEVVGLSEDPELWNDPKRAQEIGKERKILEGIVLTLDNIASGIEDNRMLIEMTVEENDEEGFAAVQEDVAELEKQRMEKHKAQLSQQANTTKNAEATNDNERELNYQKINDFNLADELKYSTVDIYLSEPKFKISQVEMPNVNKLENKYKDISINDVCVLGFSIDNLKEFEAYYRYHSHEKTNTMFETKEIAYKILLNNLPEKLYVEWQKLLQKNNIDFLAKLLTIYELYEKYNDEYHQFDITLENECKKAKIKTQDFLNFIENNRKKYEDLKNSTHQTFETIRKNKKMNFWFNSGTIKISTVHSFKGWESELVFLILEPSNSQSIDEILYTGITRSRSHLVIINFGNQEYDKKLRGLIEKINSSFDRLLILFIREYNIDLLNSSTSLLTKKPSNAIFTPPLHN